MIIRRVINWTLRNQLNRNNLTDTAGCPPSLSSTTNSCLTIESFRRGYAVTQSGAFDAPTAQPSKFWGTLVTVLMIPFAGKLGYDGAACHTDWKALNKDNQAAKVEIWNGYGIKEFIKGRENDKIKKTFGSSLTESGQMEETIVTKMKYFNDFKILAIEGKRILSLPLVDTQTNKKSTFVVVTNRQDGEWKLERSYFMDEEVCIETSKKRVFHGPTKLNVSDSNSNSKRITTLNQTKQNQTNS